MNSIEQAYDPRVQTWISRNQEITLYRIADALVGLSQAAANFKRASKEQNRMEAYACELNGFQLWERNIEVLRRAKKGEVESLVCELWVLQEHQRQSFANMKEGYLSPPKINKARSWVIQRSIEELFFWGYPNYAAMFKQLNAMAVHLIQLEEMDRNSQSFHNKVLKVGKLWEKSRQNLQKAALQERRFKIPQLRAFIQEINIDPKNVPYSSTKHAVAILRALRNSAPVRFVLFDDIINESRDITSLSDYTHLPPVSLDEETKQWTQIEYLKIDYSLIDDSFKLTTDDFMLCQGWPTQVINGCELKVLKPKAKFNFLYDSFEKYALCRLSSSRRKTVYWCHAEEIPPKIEVFLRYDLSGKYPDVTKKMIDTDLKDYDLKIKKREDFISVVFDKKQFPCFANPKVSVDCSNWGITLASIGSSTRLSQKQTTTGGKFGHAAILIEGVEEGKPFLKMIHQTASYLTGSIVVGEKQPHIRAKTKTWLVSQEKVQEFVEAWKDQSVTYLPWKNCLSWAVKGMQELGISELPSPSYYPEPNRYLLSLPDSCKPND